MYTQWNAINLRKGNITTYHNMEDSGEQYANYNKLNTKRQVHDASYMMNLK